MTRKQLEHAIRAACEVSEDSEIWNFFRLQFYYTYNFDLLKR